jgi:membrane protease YdiL (CAAX protease family)
MAPALQTVAIVVVALLFAAGHLPAAVVIGSLTPTIVSRIPSAERACGLLFGWLFWRKSLGSAMVAHASVHVVFAAVGALRWA